MADVECWRRMERIGPPARSGMAQGRADLHTHSWSSDGAQSPEDLVRAAAGRVDVLAVTDHDGIAGALRAREFARENPTLGVDVVIGEEVSTLNGHLLALYLEESVPPALPADRTIELIHAQGGLPFPRIRSIPSGTDGGDGLRSRLSSRTCPWTASRSSITPDSPAGSTTPGRLPATPSGCWRSPVAVTPTTWLTWAPR
jgi:hypothetical protein